MRLGLGIDTGGTYTDGVILDMDGGRVLSKAKTPTTRHDLVVGVDECLGKLDKELLAKLSLVSLSTTLATNAVVEGMGSRVGLIVTVPNPATFSFRENPPVDRVAVVAGSHDKKGEVGTDLDVEAVRKAVSEMAEEVDAFAVSSYFSIYNPAHEERIKELIGEACAHPVVCGHELSGGVGMVERAATAALNAKLLPMIEELLDAVSETLKKRGIRAPLMVVKGDGSIMTQDVARFRPVETVLSGPAASLLGACKLGGLSEAIVVDMGGTTTDIAVLRAGISATNPEGAVIGGWRTRVRALDMLTVGLGGDSRIEIKSKEDIRIGPRRAVPLAAANALDPSVKASIEGLTEVRRKRLKDLSLDYYTVLRKPNFKLSPYEERLLGDLGGRFVHRDEILDSFPFVDLERLLVLGCVAQASLTPTDLLHASGLLSLWEPAVSKAAVSFYAHKTGSDFDGFIERLMAEIAEALKLNIAAKTLSDEGKAVGDGYGLLSYLLRSNGEGALGVDFTVRLPVVAVGAPVEAYLPRVADELGAGLIIPENAEVANAYGAITGQVLGRSEAYIRPVQPKGFVAITPSGTSRFAAMEDAVEFAKGEALTNASMLAERDGGRVVETHLDVEESTAPLASGWGDAVLLEVKLTAIAVGEPAVGSIY